MRLDTFTRERNTTFFVTRQFRVSSQTAMPFFTVLFSAKHWGSKGSWLETDNGQEPIKIPFVSCPLQLFRIVSLRVNLLPYLPIPSRVHQSSFPSLTQIYR